MDKSVLILVDYRDGFYFSMKPSRSMDLKLLDRAFRDRGYTPCIRRFHEVDFRTTEVANRYVLYQSSEDHYLLYKSYIEDVMLGLRLAGAILVPRYELLRAHHNKVFMEILRDLSGLEEIKNIRTRSFGCLEEFSGAEIPCPAVFKTSEGQGSHGVKLLQRLSDRDRYARSMSDSRTPLDVIRQTIRGYTHRPRSSGYRRKFLVQTFIPDLKGDYKVLVFGEKYYLLQRSIRKNDFRASGGGLNRWAEEDVEPVLNYARTVATALDTPWASLDIAMKGEEGYLLEFQSLHFGTFTLERSNHHFIFKDGGWQKVEGPSLLEAEMARSFIDHVESRPLEAHREPWRFLAPPR